MCLPGSLVVALAVICGCSRISSWRHNDARDTRHLVRVIAFKLQPSLVMFGVGLVGLPIITKQANSEAPLACKPEPLCLP